MGNYVFPTKKSDDTLAQGPLPPRVEMPEIAQDRAEAAERHKARLQRIMSHLDKTRALLGTAMVMSLERGSTLDATEEQTDEVMHSSLKFRRMASPWYTRCWMDVRWASRYVRAKLGVCFSSSWRCVTCSVAEDDR